MFMFTFFFFKQKTAYEMRISDWSSDVCSSDLCADDDGLTDDEIDADDAERDDKDAEEGHHPRHGPPAVAGAHYRHQDLEDIADRAEPTIGNRPGLGQIGRAHV